MCVCVCVCVFERERERERERAKWTLTALAPTKRSDSIFWPSILYAIHNLPICIYIYIYKLIDTNNNESQKSIFKKIIW